ncbi:hypothetical protein E3V36_07450 [Candidatus Marinimicrobia bacterium MT.SAG.2]|nr:hypothetical protein E3V36_07450 [Candidatus Marinimicrobia bacterium MT.SAG.2]
MMNSKQSSEEMNPHTGPSKQLELRLAEIAKQEITDEEVAANWRTEIYGEEVIRKTLALDKLVRNKFTKANKAMFEWVENVEKMKDNKSYEQLGYTKFEDWIHNQSVSMSTVKSWLKVHEVYCKKYRFTCDELSIYDSKKLNIILPLAEIEGVTKEKVKEFLDSITSMHESDLKSMVKEEIDEILSSSEARLPDGS